MRFKPSAKPLFALGRKVKQGGDWQAKTDLGTERPTALGKAPGAGGRAQRTALKEGGHKHAVEPAAIFGWQ